MPGWGGRRALRSAAKSAKYSRHSVVWHRVPASIKADRALGPIRVPKIVPPNIEVVVTEYEVPDQESSG